MNSLLSHLVSASEWIDTPQLKNEIEVIHRSINNPTIRMGVFAPFNHGKSTLLNALLGARILPNSLKPTTGTAITIKYGTELRTRIKMQDGRELSEAGIKLLETFAVLDSDRYMREDVVAVEVYCPHPLLAKEIELVDLPGTEDAEAQDELVHRQILTLDVVIPVLDARKLLTLGEVSRLQDWLINRGITTGIFVINFMNLLEAEDQKTVIQGAQHVARSFRGSLPECVSNLYRVDALPALQAKVKGNTTSTEMSDILLLESALKQIADSLNFEELRMPKVAAIATQVNPVLQLQVEKSIAEIQGLQRENERKRQQWEADAARLRKAYQVSVSALETWLQPSNLLNCHQIELEFALEEDCFLDWQEENLQQALTRFQNEIMKAVQRACDRFDYSYPPPLSIPFPPAPQPVLPTAPIARYPTGAAIGVAGAGMVLAGPVGAILAVGAMGLLSRNMNANALQQYDAEVTESYEKAATTFLNQFSTQALNHLRIYRQAVEFAFNIPTLPQPKQLIALQDKLEVLQQCHRALERSLSHYRS